MNMMMAPADDEGDGERLVILLDADTDLNMLEDHEDRDNEIRFERGEDTKF